VTRIQTIDDQNQWNRFFEEEGSPSFLQSWDWGEFQQRQEYGILRLGVYQNQILTAVALVIKIRCRRGNFLFIPHGPVLRIKKKELKLKNILLALIDYLADVAKREGFSFVRMAPTLENSHENQRIFIDLGFKKAPVYMHAERMWVLPLDKQEDSLLCEMRKSTRYNINRAKREGVIIEKRTDKKAINDFLELYRQTAEREQFISFSKKFISDEFGAFHRNNNSLFIFAKHRKKYIATALIIFTKSSGFYHQGATSHSPIPGSHLLQWEAIQEAKRRGCRYYNFWGIDLPGRTPKNWDGLTLFKQGFGGEQVDYLPTQDLILSPKYYLTYWYEKYLNWRRGV